MKSLSISKLNSWLSTGLIAILVLFVITIIGASVFTIFFNVPMGDDYPTIATYSDRHTWLNETVHTLTNTSRYAQGFASALSYGLLRESIVYILPSLTIVWGFVLVYLYQAMLYARLGIRITKTFVCFTSAAVISLILSAGRSVEPSHVWLFYQSFFFSSAIVTYTIAILLYVTFFYVFIRYPNTGMSKPWQRLTVFVIFSFLIGLFNETAPATFFGLAILAIIFSFGTNTYSKKLRALRTYLWVFSLTCVAALSSMYFTPANSGRREATGSTYDNGLIGPIFDNFVEVASGMMYRPSDTVILVALGLVTYLAIRSNNKKFSQYSTLSVLGGVLMIASFLSLLSGLTLLTIGYGAYTAIYPRTLLLAQIFYIIGGYTLAIGASGTLLEKNLIIPRGLIKTLTLTVLIIGSTAVVAHSVSKSANHLAGVQDYQAIWMDQDAALREAGIETPGVTIYLDDRGAGIGDGFSIRCNSPFSGSTIWLNDGMEEYYGLKEICSKTDPAPQQ